MLLRESRVPKKKFPIETDNTSIHRPDCVKVKRLQVKSFKARNRRIVKTNNQTAIDFWRKLTDSIEFSKNNALHGQPMFVVGQSNIEGAGNGVFVSNNQESIRKGTVIPYQGRLSSKPTTNAVGQYYQIMISRNSYFWVSRNIDLDMYGEIGLTAIFEVG